MIKDDFYTVAYSPKNKHLHIDLMSKVLSDNLESAFNGESVDWYIVGVAPNSEEASKLTEKLFIELRKKGLVISVEDKQ